MKALALEQVEVKQEHFDCIEPVQDNYLGNSNQKYHPFLIIPIRKLPKPVNSNFNIQRAKSLNTNHWNQQEQQLYCIFVIYFEKYFAQQENRRMTKIFKCMEEFIKTRNSNQCRSHHQKQIKQIENKNIGVLIQKFKEFPKIKQNYTKKQPQLKKIQQKLTYIKVYKEDCQNIHQYEIEQQMIIPQDLYMHKRQNSQFFNSFTSSRANQQLITNSDKKQDDMFSRPTGVEYIEEPNPTPCNSKRSIFETKNIANLQFDNPKQSLNSYSLLNKSEIKSQQRPFKFKISEVHERIQNQIKKSSRMNEYQLIFQAHYHSMMWVLCNQELLRRTTQRF